MFAILHHEWVHYVADIPCQFLASRERGWAAGSSHHLRHHFISEKHWFGVSNPALDGVLGTIADRAPGKKAPRPAIAIPEGRPPGCE